MSEKPISNEELKRIQGKLDEWKDAPERYVREVLGVEKLWRLQVELLQACEVAIASHKIIYVASGHALGKDFISSQALRIREPCMIRISG